MADDLTNQAPITYLVKTVKGVRRNFIYYDADIFNETVLLSASLLIGEDKTPFIEHYNTSHDEDLGTSGTAFQNLEDIGIAIYPKPTKTSLLGSIRVLENSTGSYNIDSGYDSLNEFIYDWTIVSGDATFVSSGNNEALNVGKNVDINFNASGTIQLRCRITNPSGCYRDIIKFIYPGILTRKMLVVRNTYC